MRIHVWPYQNDGQPGQVLAETGRWMLISCTKALPREPCLRIPTGRDVAGRSDRPTENDA